MAADSEDDAAVKRDAFSMCLNQLAEKTNFDVMYNELKSSEIGKARMNSVFILRAASVEDQPRLSHDLYNGISRESDENFVLWFDAIRVALNRSGSEKGGGHARVAEAVSTSITTSRFQQRSQSESEKTLLSSAKVSICKLRKIKIVLIGPSGSGKTRFLHCAVGDPVQYTASTVGEDFRQLTFAYNDTNIQVILTDTAGQERFNAIAQNFYRGADGAMIFVDLQQFKEKGGQNTVQCTRKHINELKEHTNAELPLLLVGSKHDLVGQQLSAKEMDSFKQLADNYTEGQWICTSAKSGFNVQRAMLVIVDLVMRHKPEDNSQVAYCAAAGDMVDLQINQVPQQPKRKCCN